MAELDRVELRQAFASYLTGVTVVTALDEQGQAVGFTANSFSSVSLDPPLLLVCPARSLSSFPVFESCRHFAINILAEWQESVSNTFAAYQGDRGVRLCGGGEHAHPLCAGAPQPQLRHLHRRRAGRRFDQFQPLSATL